MYEADLYKKCQLFSECKFFVAALSYECNVASLIVILIESILVSVEDHNNQQCNGTEVDIYLY